MKLKPIYLPALLSIGLLASCKHEEKAAATSNGQVTAEEIKSQIAVLADDSLQGRKPFTAGEEKTIAYISAQFKKLGLAPGNNGSYFQDVPMVEAKATIDPTMSVSGPKGNFTFNAVKDYVIFTKREVPNIDIKNAPVVFAGYGVVAPEYHWNDYANLDVKGKIVMVLVNDPGFKSPEHLFKGDTMTYYGRWTYKFEEAARQGALGVLVIHQTEPASYGWKVVKNSNTGAKLFLQQADKHRNRCEIEGWITDTAAQKLLATAGITGDIRAYARKKTFKAVPLNLNMSVGLKNSLRYAMSHNVIAMLKGTARPDENIIYTAHWDHFGIGTPIKGDSIYNGAVDNASGSAALISIAKSYSQLKTKPQRTIVFLSVTGEEQGLLGSEYYATHPVFPLNKTVANLNMDALGFYGETKDIQVTGKGQNELEDEVATEAAKYGWHTVGDKKPGAGSYYRSDHFNFAKVGVPALDINNGEESIDHEAGWGKKQADDYNDNRYHQPSDSYSADINTTGMAQIANIMFNIGLKLANETAFPGWKPGSEFKAVRDKSMGK
jgi:Zn-dependent M28 family amino/carboxypeptidase